MRIIYHFVPLFYGSNCDESSDTCFIIWFRFCPEKYHPFDPAVLDKYVVGDDYLPTWEVPSLQKYYVDLGFNMKESLSAYLKAMGK